MDRIETFKLIRSGDKPYLTMGEAKNLFSIDINTLKKYITEYGLLEAPKYLKKKTKKPVLKSKLTLEVLTINGYPKFKKEKVASFKDILLEKILNLITEEIKEDFIPVHYSEEKKKELQEMYDIYHACETKELKEAQLINIYKSGYTIEALELLKNN